MNRSGKRLAIAIASWLAAVGCAGSVDGTGREVGNDALLQEVTSLPPMTRDEAFAEFGSVDVDEVLAVDKIRNGDPIDYDDVVGNGVVELAGGVCTAQVINRWFLLTAAHCMSGLLPFGVGQLNVEFTNRAGQRVPVYQGTAIGYGEPSWSLNFQDAAAILLIDGMDTCQHDLGTCAAADRPNNAVFQYFVPGGPQALFPQYHIVGYGTTDGGNEHRTLRRGTMSRNTSLFSGDNRGFTTVMQWQGAAQARPCQGDSGGPLVTPFSRLLHTGIASGGDSCLPDASIATYSGLSETQFLFVAQFMADFRDALGLPFHCALGSDPASGLYIFHCDNDSSLY